MGLQASNNFILYQPQNDTLALHEWIGLNLSRSTGEYASPQQFVEVRLPPALRVQGLTT